MPCRYFLGDKELVGDELKTYMKSMDIAHVREHLPEVNDGVYQAISWTPGEAQAARYDLSKQLNAVGAVKNENGTFSLEGFLPSGGVHDFGNNILVNKLADYVGKDLAEKISNQQEKAKEYSGVDLKVGGEGMKGFYDKILVNTADKLVKKMGGKVEYVDIPLSYNPNNKPKSLDEVSDYNQKIPIIRITPTMREKISKEGFPLFTAPVYVPVDNAPDFDDKKRLVPIEGNPFAPRLVPTDIQPEF